MADNFTGDAKEQFQANLEQLQVLLGLRQEQQAAAERQIVQQGNLLGEQFATTEAVYENDKKLKDIRETLSLTQQAGKIGAKRTIGDRRFDLVDRFIQRRKEGFRIRKNARGAALTFKKNFQEFSLQTDFLADIKRIQQDSLISMGLVVRRLTELVQSATGNKLQDLENAKEQKALLERLAASRDGGAGDKRQNISRFGPLKFIAALGAIIVGFFVGFVEQLKKGLKGIFGARRIAGFFTKIGKALRLDKLFGPITKGFAKIGKVLKPFGTKVKTFFTTIKNGFVKVGQKIFGFFEKIAKFFRGFSKNAKQGPGVISRLSKFFKPFLEIGKAIGRVGAKFLIPIGIAIEGLVGFFTRFKDKEFAKKGFGAKLLAGLVGAIEGILIGFIAWPIDFLKNVLAFILDKVGLDNWAEGLRSVSLVEWVKGLFDKLLAFLATKFDDVKNVGVMEKIKNFFTSIGEKIVDFFGSIGDFIKGLGPATSAALDAALKFRNPITAFRDSLAGSMAAGQAEREEIRAIESIEDPSDRASARIDASLAQFKPTEPIGAKIAAGAEAAKEAAAAATATTAAAVQSGIANLGEMLKGGGGGTGDTTVNNVTYNVQGHVEEPI